MSAQVLSFPSPAPLTPGLSQGRTLTLTQVARLLAEDDVDRRTLIRHLRELARSHGFPAPLGIRVRKGALLRGADAICQRSRWNALEVEAWLHRPDPAAPQLTGLPPLPPGLHTQLRERAQLLAAGAGA